jgi:DNA replication and repair protein RecF
MRVAALTVSNLRCLELVEYRPGAALNLICGANGSGKTSLLEGLATIGLGRSFLTAKANEVVRHGMGGMSVRGLTVDTDSRTTEIQVRREGGVTRITMDGSPVLAASTLAHHLPMLVFNSQAAELLTENPSNRRAMLDRTMFHVEPGYVEVWKRYRAALRQRNELVRAGRREEVGFWNAALGRLAATIDASRQVVVEAINTELATRPAIPKLGRLEFEYARGWSDGMSLEEALRLSWDRDLAAGYSTVGCHRADLHFKADGRTAGRRLSRGQAKLTVCLVVMGLARFIRDRRGQAPLLLVDDLAAELDVMMRARAVEMIVSLGSQCFFTAINPQDVPEVLHQADNVFHVEPDASRPVR